MCNAKFDWDDIDLTFGIELPDFGAPSDDAQLSIVDGIFDDPEDVLSQFAEPEPTRRTLH
jgi:hypothetical protein